MKRITTALVCALLSTFSAFANAADDPAVSRLSWLEGQWSGSKDGIESEERWSSPKGGALLGIHRDFKDGRMVAFEFLRIAGSKEGSTFYGSPMSAPPTPFRMTEQGAQRVRFENKAHDFPQVIEYWLDAAGLLHARIEGPQNGKTVREEWQWKKVAP